MSDNQKKAEQGFSIALVGLYFAIVAVLVAILALVNVDWDNETLSKLVLVLFVMVGAIGIQVIYSSQSQRR